MLDGVESFLLRTYAYYTKKTGADQAWKKMELQKKTDALMGNMHASAAGFGIREVS